MPQEECVEEGYKDIDMKQMKFSSKREVIITPKVNNDLTVDDGDDDIPYPKNPTADANMDDRIDDVLHPKEPATDPNVPLKNKKLKMNMHSAIPPLASIAEEVASEPVVHKDKSLFCLCFYVAHNLHEGCEL